MSYKKINKFFLFVLFFIITTYVALVFHVNDNNEDFDKLYAELKNTEKRESSSLKFVSLGEKACDYLLKKLKSEEDISTKCDIIQIIAYANCSSYGDVLLPFLYDQHWRVRFFTIDTLNKLEHKKLTNQLPEIILDDPNENVKIGAIRVMGKRGNVKDIKFLENLVARKHLQSEKIGKAVDIALDELRSKPDMRGTRVTH